ncbi:hypothetical protein OAE88_00535 [bacterium]|nr:hypothetical protein [bacterium]
MAVTDTYKQLTNPRIIDVFEQLADLKEQRKQLDKNIKELEAEYKPMVTDQDEDLFFYTSSVKFSIKKQSRIGSIDSKLMEEKGINVDDYRKKPTTSWVLRYEGQ